jgi:hypothetical protein
MTVQKPVLDYTALSERMAYLLVLRVGMAAMVLAWSAIRPEALGVPLQVLAGVASGYLVISALAEWSRRRAGRAGFWVFSGMLLLDGLFLAYAMYVTGGTQSPIRFLAYLHLVAVSLLGSYRTGLKIALWHSLLLFAVLYAQAAQLLPAVDVVPGRAVAFDSSTTWAIRCTRRMSSSTRWPSGSASGARSSWAHPASRRWSWPRAVPRLGHRRRSPSMRRCGGPGNGATSSCSSVWIRPRTRC